MTGPTIIGIGAQKCASSWVHMAMGAHPDIAVSSPKELDFFSYHFDRGYEWYARHFASMRTAHRFECSPSYFHDPRAAERAFAFDPGLKVLVLLRDPVARAYSNHLHEVAQGHIPRLGFAEGLRNNPAYLEQSLYYRHLARWMAVFPRDQVCVLLAEEIAADPIAAARRLHGFVGVPPLGQSALLQERRNVSDLPRAPHLRNALRGGGQMLRRLGLENGLARIKRSAPVRRLLQANSLDLRDVIPPMDPASRDWLDAALRDDLLALALLLNRDGFDWPTWARIAAAPGVRAVG